MNVEMLQNVQKQLVTGKVCLTNKLNLSAPKKCFRAVHTLKVQLWTIEG